MRRQDKEYLPQWVDSWWAFCVAWIFLSKLPAPNIPHFSERIVGRSLYAYPLVGLLLAGLLILVSLGLDLLALPSLLSAIILVSSWVWLTGALHLDGLADTVDAMAAAHGQPERAFAVMKDPTIGAIGAVVIVCQLLLKIGLVAALFDWWRLDYEIAAGIFGQSHALLCLIFVMVFARLSPHWHLQRADYLNDHGLARSLVQYATFHTLLLLAGLIALSYAAIGLWLHIPLISLLLVFVVLLLSWWLINLAWLKRCQQLFGGHTGDTLGAAIEINETLLLLVIVVGCYLSL